MCGVGLHDHRISYGEGRRCIAPAIENASGKVACPEDGHGPDRKEHRTKIGAGWSFTVWQLGVDACVLPRTLFDYCGEQTELPCGPSDLTHQSDLRETAFEHGGCNESGGCALKTYSYVAKHNAAQSVAEDLSKETKASTAAAAARFSSSTLDE